MTIKKRKPTVLVAEGGAHFKCIENTYQLLHKHCNLTFYFTESGYNGSDLMFPSKNKTRIIRNRTYTTLFFLWLIFVGREYDYIDISTGPERDKLNGLFRSICFYFCCRLYGRKMYLCIRSIPPYLESSGNIQSYIRSRCLKYIAGFTFETATQRAAFREHSDMEGALCGVRYDRYTDLLKVSDEALQENLNDAKVRIGMLGGIVPHRRDYQSIFNVLRKLSEEERAAIKIVTLGNCKEGRGTHVVKELEALVEVDWKLGYMTEAEFEARGVSCDFLIAPQSPDGQYGTLKGTGTLGDAVYLRKKIMLPRHLDPEEEFKEISLYYDDYEQLLAILKDIRNLSVSPTDPEYYEKYSTKSVYRKLVKDLELNCR